MSKNRVQKIAYQLEDRSNKIHVRSYYESKKPETEDDLIYIGEHITVQVGPDYFLVILGYNGPTGNLSHTIFPLVTTIKECVKQIEDALGSEK